jgi:hypothetical protein
MSRTESRTSAADAVRTLISAYNDGLKIARKIKDRRESQGAQVPDVQLERVLQQGANDIQRAADEGSQDYGSRFDNDGRH